MLYFQVAYPTDAEGKPHWPKETFSMEGLFGPDFLTNYMLKERMAVEKDLSEISEAPDRYSVCLLYEYKSTTTDAAAHAAATGAAAVRLRLMRSTGLRTTAFGCLQASSRYADVCWRMHVVC